MILRGVFFFPWIFSIYFMHWWLWNWLVNSRGFSGAVEQKCKTTCFLLGVIPVSAGQGELAHSYPLPWDQIKNWLPLTLKTGLQRPCFPGHHPKPRTCHFSHSSGHIKIRIFALVEFSGQFVSSGHWSVPIYKLQLDQIHEWICK